MVVKRISVHGHRGAPVAFPENTLISFQHALNVGVDFIEMDVAVTQDDVLVISHDPERVKGDERIVIREMSFERLRAWDPAIPTLDEVLALGGGFNIELKSFPDAPRYTPAPEKFARLVWEAIHRRGVEARCIVKSFDFRVLHALHGLAPDVRRSGLWEGERRSFVAIAAAAGANMVSPHFRLIDPDAVQEAHAAAIEVHTWTPNRPEDWSRLISAGVDGIITDNPAGLIALLHAL